MLVEHCTGRWVVHKSVDDITMEAEERSINENYLRKKHYDMLKNEQLQAWI